MSITQQESEARELSAACNPRGIVERLHCHHQLVPALPLLASSRPLGNFLPPDFSYQPLVAPITDAWLAALGRGRAAREADTS